MYTQPPDLDALIVKLQIVPILQGLEPAILAKVAQHVIRRSYTPGTVIFLEGDAAPALYYVDSGWVKIIKMSSTGREQILYYWGAGELFGGVSFFVDHPVPATAIALEVTELWILPRDPVSQMLVSTPASALQVIEYLANRINELMALVTDLSLYTITERLAHLLLEQAEGDVVHRQRWATQADMAARLGTVPDALSRALHGLVEEGLIEVARDQIRILDRHGLAAKTTRIT